MGSHGFIRSASPCPLTLHPRDGPRSLPEHGVGQKEPNMLCTRALLVEVWSSHSISQPLIATLGVVLTLYSWALHQWRGRTQLFAIVQS
jgi:hypothetical protein